LKNDWILSFTVFRKHPKTEVLQSNSSLLRKEVLFPSPKLEQAQLFRWEKSLFTGIALQSGLDSFPRYARKWAFGKALQRKPSTSPCEVMSFPLLPSWNKFRLFAKEKATNFR